MNSYESAVRKLLCCMTCCSLFCGYVYSESVVSISHFVIDRSAGNSMHARYLSGESHGAYLKDAPSDTRQAVIWLAAENVELLNGRELFCKKISFGIKDLLDINWISQSQIDIDSLGRKNSLSTFGTNTKL